MRKILSSILCTTIFLASACSSALADFTISTVSVNRVLKESKEAQTKKKELDELSNKAKKKVEDKKSTLQAIEKKIKDGIIGENSPEAKTFRNDAKDFGNFVKETEGQLREEFLKFNKELTEKTLNLVAQYAKTNHIDLVIDKSDGSRGPVLYGNVDADITDAIVKLMNQ